MSRHPRREVAIDTGIFGADLLTAHAPLAAAYQGFIVGRAVFISFITVAELRHGARRAGLGPDPPTAAPGATGGCGGRVGAAQPGGDLC